jgi:Ulp1 family protease
MTKAKIQCLNPQRPGDEQWLNDEVINFYLEMLKEKFHSNINKLHIFDTYFMEKLSSPDIPTIAQERTLTYFKKM